MGLGTYLRKIFGKKEDKSKEYVILPASKVVGYFERHKDVMKTEINPDHVVVISNRDPGIYMTDLIGNAKCGVRFIPEYHIRERLPEIIKSMVKETRKYNSVVIIAGNDLLYKIRGELEKKGYQVRIL